MTQRKVLVQFSTGLIGGVLTAIVYIKRPNRKYRMYKLTRSSAKRIQTLWNVIICK